MDVVHDCSSPVALPQQQRAKRPASTAFDEEQPRLHTTVLPPPSTPPPACCRSDATTTDDANKRRRTTPSLLHNVLVSSSSTSHHTSPISLQYQNDLRFVTHRVVSKLVAVQQQGAGLPATIASFLRAIEPMCNVTSKVDAQVVFYHLLLNNVITINNDGSMTSNISNLNTNFVGFVPSDTMVPNASFCNGFATALQRAANLVRTTMHLPHTAEAIIDMLAPVCCIRREVEPSTVLEALEAFHLVCTRGQAIMYALPDAATMPNEPAIMHFASAVSQST
jgi:hypothetical protein